MDDQSPEPEPPITQPPTTRHKRSRWPRFSVAAILFLISCVSVALTIAAQQPREENNALGFALHQPQVEWHYALLSLATIGVASGLFSQANALAGRAGFGATRWLRCAHAAALLVLLGVRVLMQRGVITLPEREEFLATFTEVFPDSLLLLLLIVGALALSKKPSAPRRNAGLLCVLGMIAGGGLAMVVVADLATISFLVHIACQGIELGHPPSLQRLGQYPYHPMEGFRTYRAALLAMAGLAGTVAGAWGAFASRSWIVRGLCITVCVACGGGLLWFNHWWYTSELPRVSPDLASTGPVAIPSDWFFAAVFILTLALWLACELVGGEATDTTPLEDGRRLGPAPRLLAAIGLIGLGGLDAVDAIRGLFDFVGFWGPPTAAEVIGGLFRYFFVQPTGLLITAVLLSGFRIAIALWRGRGAVVNALPVGRVVVAWGGLVGLLVIAVPTLAAWSFASWLGPL